VNATHLAITNRQRDRKVDTRRVREVAAAVLAVPKR
jgi:hypothetical protein